MDLVFSDIHADIEGLEIILDVAFSADFENQYGKVSRIISLGDLLERGISPKQVLQKMNELSKSYQMISVMGNHDEGFLYKRFLSGSSLSSIKAHESLTQRDIEFFKQNKDSTYGVQFIIDSKAKLYCVHGGPINPEKIIKTDNPWLYQRTWQRLSEQDREFFSYYGYHYKPSSAFAETRTIFDNFVILCGHQHVEAALKEDSGQITNIWPYQYTTEKTQHLLKKREIPINKKSNYLIRLGLGGPQGYYGTGSASPHFGIIQDNPRKVILFEVQ